MRSRNGSSSRLASARKRRPFGLRQAPRSTALEQLRADRRQPRRALPDDHRLARARPACRERLERADGSIERLVGHVPQPVAASQHREPGHHRHRDGRGGSGAPSAGAGAGSSTDGPPSASADDDADTHRAAPFVERVEHVGVAELHAHRPATGALAIVALEVAVDAGHAPPSTARPARPSRARVRTPARRSGSGDRRSCGTGVLRFPGSRRRDRSRVDQGSGIRDQGSGIRDRAASNAARRR